VIQDYRLVIQDYRLVIQDYRLVINNTNCIILKGIIELNKCQKIRIHIFQKSLQYQIMI
jgi:hypothetical protein